MSEFSEMLLPLEFLVRCLNVVVASFAVCTISVVASRRLAWSLPVRHSLLVAGLSVVLLLPFVVPLCPLPAVWSIGVSETLDWPLPSPIDQQFDGIQFEDSEVTVSRSLSVAETQTVGPSIATPAIPVTRTQEQPAALTPPGFQMVGTLLCAIWLAGIAVMLGRVMLGLIKLRTWMQSIANVESPVIRSAALAAAEGVGLRSNVPIYHSALLPAPVTNGLLHQRIVVPLGIESDLSFNQLRAVLQHEMAHIVRHDLWVGLLQQAASIVYWWNPLVHLANGQLADLREQICDDIAVRELSEPSSYAATLIKLAERCTRHVPIPATLGIGTSPMSQLERRVLRILSSSESRRTKLSRWSIAGVSAMTALMMATILLAEVEIKPAEKATPQASLQTPNEGATTAGSEAQPQIDARLENALTRSNRNLNLITSIEFKSTGDIAADDHELIFSAQGPASRSEHVLPQTHVEVSSVIEAFAGPGSRYQLFRNINTERILSLQDSHPPVTYEAGIKNPILVPYYWVATGTDRYSWLTIRDKSRWDEARRRTRYLGREKLGDYDVDVIEMKHTNPNWTYQVYLAREHGWLPIRWNFEAEKTGDRESCIATDLRQFKVGNETAFLALTISKFDAPVGRIRIDEASLIVNGKHDKTRYEIDPSTADEIQDLTARTIWIPKYQKLIKMDDPKNPVKAK